MNNPRLPAHEDGDLQLYASREAGPGRASDVESPYDFDFFVPPNGPPSRVRMI